MLEDIYHRSKEHFIRIALLNLYVRDACAYVREPTMRASRMAGILLVHGAMEITQPFAHCRRDGATTTMDYDFCRASYERLICTNI